MTSSPDAPDAPGSPDAPYIGLIDLPGGPARIYDFQAREPQAVLVLGHGAGGGVKARDLTAISEVLPAAGIRVVLVQQPWSVAGKKMQPAPAKLDLAWVTVINQLGLAEGSVPLVTGGRSTRARIACRTANDLGVAGVVALAFPLHPPGQPAKTRLPELLEPQCPMLVVQGVNDSFGTSPELDLAAAEAGGRITVVPIEGADHGMRVPAKVGGGQAGALAQITAAVAEFVRSC